MENANLVWLQMEEAWSSRLLHGVWESCGACLASRHSCIPVDKASGVSWLLGQIGCFCYLLATWQWTEQIFFGLHWTCRCYVGCMIPIRWRHTPVCERRKGGADVCICHSTHFYMTLPFHMKQTPERMPTLQLPQTTYSEITINIPILATKEVMWQTHPFPHHTTPLL